MSSLTEYFPELELHRSMADRDAFAALPPTR